VTGAAAATGRAGRSRAAAAAKAATQDAAGSDTAMVITTEGERLRASRIAARWALPATCCRPAVDVMDLQDCQHRHLSDTACFLAAAAAADCTHASFLLACQPAPLPAWYAHGTTSRWQLVRCGWRRWRLDAGAPKPQGGGRTEVEGDTGPGSQGTGGLTEWCSSCMTTGCYSNGQLVVWQHHAHGGSSCSVSSCPIATLRVVIRLVDV